MFFHGYLAQMSYTTFLENLRFDTDFGDSWLLAFGVGQQFWHSGPHSHLEWELNVAGHTGMQDNMELNALVTERWDEMPWNHVMPTTLAFGIGISMASEVPFIEEEFDEEGGTRTQVFMLFEVTARHPEWKNFTPFIRIHHRSGVFGLVSHKGGSNFIGLGLRRWY